MKGIFVIRAPTLYKISYQNQNNDKKVLICRPVLRFSTCVGNDLMEGSISGCIYLFKFGNFCRNSAKQATALYVQYCIVLLKTSLRINEESFMFSSQNYVCVKIWFIVTVVCRLLAELAKIRKI
jgi:hypothetical protein